MIADHLELFADLPVEDFDPHERDVPPSGALRISSDRWDSAENEMVPLLDLVAAEPWARHLTALVQGDTPPLAPVHDQANQPKSPAASPPVRMQHHEPVSAGDSCSVVSDQIGGAPGQKVRDR